MNGLTSSFDDIVDGVDHRAAARRAGMHYALNHPDTPRSLALTEGEERYHAQQAALADVAHAHAKPYLPIRDAVTEGIRRYHEKWRAA